MTRAAATSAARVYFRRVDHPPYCAPNKGRRGPGKISPSRCRGGRRRRKLGCPSPVRRYGRRCASGRWWWGEYPSRCTRRSRSSRWNWCARWRWRPRGAWPSRGASWRDGTRRRLPGRRRFRRRRVEGRQRALGPFDPIHLGLRDPEVSARADNDNVVAFLVRLSSPKALPVREIDRVCARISRQDDPRDCRDDHPDHTHSLSSSVRGQPCGHALNVDARDECVKTFPERALKIRAC